MIFIEPTSPTVGVLCTLLTLSYIAGFATTTVLLLLGAPGTCKLRSLLEQLKVPSGEVDAALIWCLRCETMATSVLLWCTTACWAASADAFWKTVVLISVSSLWGCARCYVRFSKPPQLASCPKVACHVYEHLHYKRCLGDSFSVLAAATLPGACMLLWCGLMATYHHFLIRSGLWFTGWPPLMQALEVICSTTTPRTKSLHRKHKQNSLK